jgi:peptidoglycan/LPS O-acetylase OafA/YrhL
LAVLGFGLLFPYSRLLFDRWEDWVRLFAHVLLCHNFSSVALVAISPAYWSIAVEAQLYLLFPALLLLVRRYSFSKVLWITAIIELSLHFISLVWYLLHHTVPFWIVDSPFYYWFSWSIGAAIADAHLKGEKLPFQRISPWSWLLAAIATSAFSGHEFSFTFFALASASLMARRLTVDSSSSQPRSVVGRFLALTGTYSYSIYLIHHPLVIAVAATYQRFFPGIENHPMWMFSAALSAWVLIFPLSALVYHTVEKPSIALGKRLLKARSRRLVRPASTTITPTFGTMSN